MAESAPPVTVFCRSLAFAAKQPACGQQAVYANGSTSMNSTCGDAHLGAESVAIAVGKTGGGVPKNRGGIHAGQEVLSDSSIAGNDCVGVTGTVFVNMVHGCVEIVYGLDRQDQVSVLGLPVLFFGSRGGEMAEMA